MKITVNSGRYYAEDMAPGAFDACMSALSVYNTAKIKLYNAMYEHRYHEGSDHDVLGKPGTTYASFLKECAGLNAYDAASLYSDVSGILSSQREFRKWYLQTQTEDLKARKAKTASLAKKLDQLLAVKQTLVTYAKTGRFVRPYKGCQLKISGQKACPYGKKTFPLADYERSVEQQIRRTKARLHSVRAAMKRKEARLERFAGEPPARVLFGSKAFYKTKDTVGCDDAWKKAFHERRTRSMMAAGRHTSKSCNFVVKPDGAGGLVWNLPAGLGAVTFPAFRLRRYHKEWTDCLQQNAENRQAVSYRMKRMRDGHGREYLIVSATFMLPEHEAPADLSDGCIACDLNVDHLAWAELDKSGAMIRYGIIPYHLEHLSSTQRDQVIGDVVSRAAVLNKETGKALVFEDLDLTAKRASLKYGNKKSNLLISAFAYKSFRAHLDSQGFRKGFSAVYVDPAYTSFCGKVMFMRKFGVSTHVSAAYCIGLRSLGILDDLTIPDHLGHLMDTKKEQGPYYVAEKISSLYTKLKNIRTHAFYLDLPDVGTVTKLKTWLRVNDQNKPAWYAADF